MTAARRFMEWTGIFDFVLETPGEEGCGRSELIIDSPPCLICSGSDLGAFERYSADICDLVPDLASRQYFSLREAGLDQPGDQGVIEERRARPIMVGKPGEEVALQGREGHAGLQTQPRGEAARKFLTPLTATGFFTWNRRPAEAVPKYERALELDPSFATAHWLLGLALNYLGLAEKAFEHADKAASLCPRDLLARGTAFEHIARAKFAAGLPYVDGFALVGKSRVPCRARN